MGFISIRVFPLSHSTFQLRDCTPAAPSTTTVTTQTLGLGAVGVRLRVLVGSKWGQPNPGRLGRPCPPTVRRRAGARGRRAGRGRLPQPRAAGQAGCGSRHRAPPGGGGWVPNPRSYAAEGRRRRAHFPTGPGPAVEGKDGRPPRYLTQGQLLLYAAQLFLQQLRPGHHRLLYRDAL